ncbi:MAG: helix-hairpin-helix domain-containing protein, partial [Clostridia bacterium]
DSYTRLIFPSIEREVRNDLTDMASEQAIKMFEVNLKPLLLQPPLKSKVVMGFDPAYRTGCKIAVIDANGKVLDSGVVYPTPPQSKVDEANLKLKAMIEKHKVDVISIGNGTASKESEIFVANLIKLVNRKVEYIVVNEAGASVYSASKLGAEEFPEFDVSIRSAVSIARRLQDPLAELIKIDVKSIGVGQYQHDMPQKRLTEVLQGVVEDCVNSVGVDLNTASASLLSYISGLNATIAKNIVKYREEKAFAKRAELLKIAKLGPKAFEQCAGFLRISESKNVLDNTGVHPESYEVCEKLLQKFNLTDSDVAEFKIGNLETLVKNYGASKLAKELEVGEPTLLDIVKEIIKPGRDIRDGLPAPILRADLMDIKNLKEGMVLTGTVRNVIDFGAFVDIGVHQDGLVHISQICNEYIKHPSEVLSVGDAVKVKVMNVDAAKGRINLTMKELENAEVAKRIVVAGQNNSYQRNNNYNQNGNYGNQNGASAGKSASNNAGKNGNNGNYNNKNERYQSKPNPQPKDENQINSGDTLESMLAKLKNKYN